MKTNINIDTNISTYNKLNAKMEKRVGMTATTTDDMKTGTITGYTISEGLVVKYLIAFGEGKHARLRLTNESWVSIHKAPNSEKVK